MHRAAVTLVSLLLCVASLQSAARANAPSILVDGVAVHTDVPSVEVGGHVLVPLRGVFERFGATVDYDAKNDVAVATRGGVTVKVAVDTTDAWVNGRHVTLDVAARELGGRVEVPLRFVAEALGVSVDYDAVTNTVVIVSGFKEGNFVAAGPGTPALQNTSAAAYGPAAPTNTPPSVSEESPASGSLVGSQYPQIYARFSGGSSPVDPATVRLMVDGVDVTDSATVSSAYVAYTPSSPLSSGSHVVEVSGQAEDGARFDDRWSFRIDEGVSASYVSSVIGFAPSAFGVPRFGFFPPGFSVFAPGDDFFFEDEPIVIVFFSPFFPNGTGFFTISGFPGQFPMNPWLGCPGFFWSVVNVPAGLDDPNAIVGARFTTSSGRTVIVHSTAPIRIDGTRRSAPADLHFDVKAQLVNRAPTPRSLVDFHRLAFSHIGRVAHITALTHVGRAAPIVRSAPLRSEHFDGRPVPIARRMPVVTMPIIRRYLPEPILIPARRIAPPIQPPVVIRPIMPSVPAPRPMPMRPVPPMRPPSR